MRAAIIGSGMAGLTAAAVLAKDGHQVTVFEQFERPGGVTAPYEQVSAGKEHSGYHWDLGQLIIEGLGPDEPLGLILQDLGVYSKLRLQVQDRGYVFPDFEIKKPAEYAGPRWRIDYLKSLFPQDAAGLDRYWQDYLRFTRLTSAARKMGRAKGLERLAWQVRLYARLLPFLSKMKWSAQQLMDSYFQSPQLQAVFISILADFFTPPSQFPGLGVFALNPEAVYEKRMPREIAPGAEQLYHYNILGGISTMVDALVEKIKALGGQVHCSSPVEKILIESGKVVGVFVNGETVLADLVIASGGAKETFFKLVGEENLTPEFIEKVKGQPLMDSVFMLHLGVDFDPTPYLHGPVTYFYNTYDIEAGLEEAHQGIYHEGEKGFVVHVPSLHSPEMAPQGCHALTVYTVSPDRLAEGSWAERKEAFADRLLELAEQRIPGLCQHIQTLQIITPEEWRKRTHLDQHAFGGIAPIQNTPRVPHQTPIEGLWFVGAQSQSGGGVNNVIPAAYKVARLAAKLN
jgi:phytoene dehydrogenase-like protein